MPAIPSSTTLLADSSTSCQLSHVSFLNNNFTWVFSTLPFPKLHFPTYSISDAAIVILLGVDFLHEIG